MPATDNVRSLQRGLSILQVLNRHSGLKAGQVARITGIPRPTTYRLLETLEGLGFVARGPSDDAWRPTLQAKSLSAGFREEFWVAQIAVPRMLQLGEQVLWPLDLVAFHDFRMVVRESTHAVSPYSIDHGMVGRGLPILETSGGRAFLAFSPESERRHVLAGLAARPHDDHPLLHDPAGLEHLLASCRQHGVGYRTEGFNPHTKSISAPIIVNGRVLSCLSLIWISSALRLEDALDQFAPRLIDAANGIAAEIAMSDSGKDRAS